MKFLLSLTLALSCLMTPQFSHARTAEPGDISVGGQLGLGSRMSSKLGAGGYEPYLMLGGTGEYAIDMNLAAAGELSLALGRSIPIRLRAGAKYRLTGLELPISPYGLGQLSVGRIYDVLGADLTLWGIRLGVGADYFLTKKFSAGVLLAIDLGSSLGTRPAMYGTFEVLFGATYAL